MVQYIKWHLQIIWLKIGVGLRYRWNRISCNVWTCTLERWLRWHWPHKNHPLLVPLYASIGKEDFNPCGDNAIYIFGYRLWTMLWHDSINWKLRAAYSYSYKNLPHSYTKNNKISHNSITCAYNKLPVNDIWGWMWTCITMPSQMMESDKPPYLLVQYNSIHNILYDILYSIFLYMCLHHTIFYELLQWYVC